MFVVLRTNQITKLKHSFNQEKRENLHFVAEANRALLW